jgi:hypothetical protein
VWLSLVEHLVRDEGVAGSNPATPTKNFKDLADLVPTFSLVGPRNRPRNGLGAAKKDDLGKVAKDGFKAMMAGEGGVVSGWQNKLEAAAAHVMPAERLAKKHTEMAVPGTAKK